MLGKQLEPKRATKLSEKQSVLKATVFFNERFDIGCYARSNVENVTGKLSEKLKRKTVRNLKKVSKRYLWELVLGSKVEGMCATPDLGQCENPPRRCQRHLSSNRTTLAPYLPTDCKIGKVIQVQAVNSIQILKVQILGSSRHKEFSVSKELSFRLMNAYDCT